MNREEVWDGTSAASPFIQFGFRHLFPYRVSVVHDWAHGVAEGTRSPPDGRRPFCVPYTLRFLAQGFRGRIWSGCFSGVVMAFQCGTNWCEMAKIAGPVQGPLLSYETFTAFMLEASFFGILIFGRPRLPP